MPTGSNSYIFSIRGLLLNDKNVSKTIEEDIDEFISMAPTLADNIRSSLDERRRSFGFMQNMNTAIFMLKSVSAKWLLTEAEAIRQLAESNHMDMCYRKIEPFLSDFLALSIEMQMAQKRAAADQSGGKKNEVEAYTDIVNNLTAVTYLIAANEYDKAAEIILDMKDLLENALTAKLLESLHPDGREAAEELAKRLIDQYAGKMESLSGPASDPSKKILIVDDRPDMLRTVAAILRGQYKVSAAAAGKDALKLLELQAPDMFILDIDMPDMNGFELAQKIRSMDAFADTPILFLTSNSTRDYVLKAIESGGNDFVVKPVGRGALLSRVAKYL